MSTRENKGRKQDRKADGRQLTARTIAELKAAAYEIIADNGLSALTISALAERTGYSTAIVNYHFGSKASFLRSLVDDAFDDAQRSIETSFPAADTLSSFRTLFDRIGVFFKDRRQVTRVYMNLLSATPGFDEQLMRAVQDHNDRIRSLFAAQIRAGQAAGTVRKSLDAEATAFAIHGATRGIVSLALAGNAAELEPAFDALHQWLAAAFRADRPRPRKDPSNN